MPKTRKPKTNRVPRTRAGGTWTEAQFWNFLVNNLRKISIKWPPLQRLWSDHDRDDCRPNTGPGLHKWEHRCVKCGEWLPNKRGKTTLMHADHIAPSLPLTTPEHIGPFVMRLFCELDGLQKVCVSCHKQDTAERRRKRSG